MSKKNSDESVPKNFITNIAFEIRFIPLLKIIDRISEYQEKIRNRLPSAEYGFPIISTDRRERMPEELNEWRFTSKNKDEILKITVSRLTYIKTNYSTFEEFISRVLSYIEDFIEFTEINEFNRIGLRYNNEYSLKEKPIDELLDLFNSYINVDKIKNKAPYSFSVEYRWSQENNKVTCWNVLRTDNIGNLVYIIDIDAFNENITNSSDLKGVTNELHSLIKEAFNENIKEKFREILRGEK